MNEILDKILINTFTLHNLNVRFRLLKDLAINKSFSKLNSLTKEQQEQNDKENLLWLNSIEDNFFNQFNADNIYQKFDLAEEEIKKLNPLVIYIPFEIPEKDVVNLGIWIRQNFKGIFLFDLKYDPNLIGGIALVWNGIYRDYSLKGKIESEKGQILESFKNFIK